MRAAKVLAALMLFHLNIIRELLERDNCCPAESCITVRNDLSLNFEVACVDTILLYEDVLQILNTLLAKIFVAFCSTGLAVSTSCKYSHLLASHVRKNV